MAENKRTKMLAIQTRMDVADAAGSLQKQINAIEADGHYVMQYIALNAYDGIILAHDYPDKKNRDVDWKPAPAPAPAPEPDQAAEETDLPKTDETVDTGIPAVEAPDLTAPESVKPAPAPAKSKGKGRR